MTEGAKLEALKFRHKKSLLQRGGEKRTSRERYLFVCQEGDGRVRGHHFAEKPSTSP
jgi:hypothetical protein